MWTQTAMAAGVLALLTVVPGPDMAVVTKRAIASGRADALRTVAGVTVFERPRVRRLLDRVTGVVLIGFGARVAAEAN
ncbi:hypothetical protein OIE54_40480 [Streptomyces sp. NBC_01794]|nr:hypothetical protein [Streptomyces sp. NBC_01750]WSB04951.1 hypothetical protein OIE54_40480 [Streptomyces sp. NBC_01794]WSD30774.1 hypothetical protein OG966_01640 [Streptomyces sp. NBC_01750]